MKTRMFDPSLDYGLLPTLTGFALRRASLLDFGGFGEALGDRAITPLRYSMLEVIGANPGLRQVQLADILGLAKPAATIAIDFWQARECVTRNKDERDRRSYGVYLTETGEETLSDLQRRVVAHDTRLTQCLSAPELDNLRRYLKRIYEQ
ncbi:MAG TPA: MarR family transcriptional regulator [Sphingomonadaceae bacterium]